MLRQVRHISEGNFYGLRVTNKARKLNLDKELRTLEACKDVQSHVYRKEEKELISTLKRLQQTKQDQFDYQPDQEQTAGHLKRHHDRHPSAHAKKHDAEHRLLRRPTESSHDTKVQVKVRSDIRDQSSSTKTPCQVKVVTDASDVSVIISLSPVESQGNDGKQTAFPPVGQQNKQREVGAVIHRTQAFMSCVICNLPRYAQGRDNKNTCTCHVDPTKHPRRENEHQDIEASKKRRKSDTDDEELTKFAAKRERRRSLEIDNLLPYHKTKHGNLHHSAHQKHMGRSRGSSLEEDNKKVEPNKTPSKTLGFSAYTGYIPGIGASGPRHIFEKTGALNEHHEHEQGMRSRHTSFSESKNRKNNLDEGRSRKSSLTEDRSRGNSVGEHDEPHYMRPLKGHYGSRHNRGRQDEELHDLYNRLHRIFHHGEDRAHKKGHYPGEHPHATYLPLSKSRRNSTDNSSGSEDPAPAFSGLLHPDNIINHHHFLPYEASKHDKHRATYHHATHPLYHPSAYRVTGIDSHGIHQEVSGSFFPPSLFTWIFDTMPTLCPYITDWFFFFFTVVLAFTFLTRPCFSLRIRNLVCYCTVAFVPTFRTRNTPTLS